MEANFGYEYTVKNRNKILKAIHLVDDGNLMCGADVSFFVVDYGKGKQRGRYIKCQKCIKADMKNRVAEMKKKMQDAVEYTKTMF